MAYKKHFHKNSKRFSNTKLLFLVFLIGLLVLFAIFFIHSFNINSKESSISKIKVTSNVVDIRETDNPETEIAEQIADNSLKSNVDVGEVVDLQISEPVGNNKR
jgi:hypothetical protein